MEANLLQLLRARFRAEAPRNVLEHVGDDAAVLAWESADFALVASVDSQVEGTHFERTWLSLEDIGYRATMAAASDLAAMGAQPVCLLAALGLPSTLREHEVDALAQGQQFAARELGCALVGGNLTRSPGLSITTTALGRVEAGAQLLRRGAHAGDNLWIVGDLGWSRAGLLALQAGIAAPALTLAFRRPRARIAAGRALLGVATACMDVSDGLAADACVLARESAALLHLESTQLLACVHTEWRDSMRDERAQLACVVLGGEDYALLFSAPAAWAPSEEFSAQCMETPRRIGTVRAGAGVEIDAQPIESWLDGAAAFEHFTTP